MPRTKQFTPHPTLKRRGKSGIWQIKWTDPQSGTTRIFSTGTSNEREAQLALANFIANLHLPKKAINLYTINELLDAYLEDRENIANVKGLEYSLKPIRRYWGDKLIEYINKVSVKEYRKERENEGKRNGTIRKELSTLKSALRLAFNEQKISYVPVFELPPKGAPREKWVTKEQAKKLLEAARYEMLRQEDGTMRFVYSPEGIPHIYVYILILMSTLARDDAILELTWDRIDFEARLINFHNPDKIETNKRRSVVPMNDELFEVLRKAKQAALSDYVIEYAGKPIKSIDRSFETAAKRAGLDGVTPNVLRHSGATWLAMSGVSMYAIARLMGHSDIQTTYKNYAKYTPDFLSEAVKMLS